MANSFPASGLAYADSFSVGNASAVNSSLYVCSTCVQAVRIEHNFDQTNLHHNTLWLRASNNGALEAASIGFTVVNDGGDHHRANIVATADAGQTGGNLALYSRRNSDGADVLGLYINNVGSVGVGTCSPSPHNGIGLVVNGRGSDTRGIIELWDSGASSGKSVFQNVGGDTYIGQLGRGTGNGDVYLLTGGSGVSATISMVIKCAGNVGIGTTTPAYKLQVVNSGAVGVSIVTAGSDSGNPSLQLLSGATDSTISSTSTGLELTAYSAHALLLRTANVERMRVTSGGNVGIGTTSPASRLTIAGDVGIGSSIGSSTYSGPSQYGAITFPRAQLLFSNTNPQSQFYFVSNSTLNSSSQFTYTCNGRAGKINIDDGSISLDVASSAAAGCVISWINGITILNNGNVGIGTTNPTFSLDVCASANNQGIRINSVQAAALYLYSTFNNAGNRNWGIYNNSTVFGDFDIRQSNAKDGDMTVGANSTSRLYIKNDGKVGIGTTSPTPFFQVCGNQSGENVAWVQNTNSNGYGSLRALNDTNTAAVFGVGGSAVGTPYANNGYLYTDSTVNFVFAMGGAERMRILCTGNVGINTSSPSYRLHVNGTFYAAGSSQDYKEGICQYNTDSCLFMCLKPKTYQYKDEWKHLGKELKSGTQIGLIAEEVAESHPELAILVNEEDNKVVRNVDYEKLSIILLSEVQKLRQEVDQLKNK